MPISRNKRQVVKRRPIRSTEKMLAAKERKRKKQIWRRIKRVIGNVILIILILLLFILVIMASIKEASQLKHSLKEQDKRRSGTSVSKPR